MNKLPFEIIEKAVNADPNAMKQVLHHYSGYIATLSKVRSYDENGNVRIIVDYYIKRRLETKLMKVVLTFDLLYQNKQKEYRPK